MLWNTEQHGLWIGKVESELELVLEERDELGLSIPKNWELEMAAIERII